MLAKPRVGITVGVELHTKHALGVELTPVRVGPIIPPIGIAVGVDIIGG